MSSVTVSTRRSRLSLRFVALGYLAVLLLAPVVLVFSRTFEHGFGAFWDSITTPQAISAFWLTITIAVIVVPLNTVFGLICAHAIVRRRGKLARVLDAALDLPYLISPVVVGLALFIVYRTKGGWIGHWLAEQGITVMFTPTGMVLATLFVSLPFVAREVAPVLEEIGTEQEEASATLGASRWQTYRRVTLPAIRWALVYGVVLTTARSIGEFGAVSIVSGHIAGQTVSLPLLVSQRFEALDPHGAYAAAALLALIALFVLLVMTLVARRIPDGHRSS